MIGTQDCLYCRQTHKIVDWPFLSLEDTYTQNHVPSLSTWFISDLGLRLRKVWLSGKKWHFLHKWQKKRQY